MGEIKRECRLYEGHNNYWTDANGWLYKREGNGPFILVTAAPPLTWWQKFKRWATIKQELSYQ